MKYQILKLAGHSAHDINGFNASVKSDELHLIQFKRKTKMVILHIYNLTISLTKAASRLLISLLNVEKDIRIQRDCC